MNAIYLKADDGSKLYLIDTSPVDLEPTYLKITTKYNDKTFNETKKFLEELNGIIIYSNIVQEDGRETDEFVLQEFSDYKKLLSLEYNLVDKTYSAIFVIPDIVEERLDALEKKSEELPPLTSPFTTNVEPTGIASRYYEAGELIAIYDEYDHPITVRVVFSISSGQHITRGLNVYQYFGD